MGTKFFDRLKELAWNLHHIVRLLEKGLQGNFQTGVLLWSEFGHGVGSESELLTTP